MDIQIEVLEGYPVRSFAIKSKLLEKDIDFCYQYLSEVLSKFTDYFLEKDIPHNLLFSDKGSAIFVIPRKLEKFQNSDNIKCGFYEIGGIGICRNKEFYDSLDEESYEEMLRKEVSLEEPEFEKIVSDIKDIFSL